MIFDVSHKTLYTYEASVVQSQHLIHMSPRVIAGQTIRHHSLIVEPAPTQRTQGTDAFGNPYTLLEIEVPHTELVLHARSRIETSKSEHPDFSSTSPWDDLRDRILGINSPAALEIIQMACPSRLAKPSMAIADYARPSLVGGRPVLEAARHLTNRIYDEFTFDSTATDISTPLSVVLSQRRGVCQDFSHLAVACFRAFGIPARYVSGYILTRPPPGQQKLQGTDASHAWISVWAPETGWVDFDPTNGILAGDEHIAICYGRDYDDVSPITGVLVGGGDHTVDVGVDVIAAEELRPAP